MWCKYLTSDVRTSHSSLCVALASSVRRKITNRSNAEKRRIAAAEIVRSLAKHSTCYYCASTKLIFFLDFAPLPKKAPQGSVRLRNAERRNDHLKSADDCRSKGRRLICESLNLTNFERFSKCIFQAFVGTDDECRGGAVV
jgi:hypothetical protein